MQVGPQGRTSWSTKRLAQAIDQLVDMGLIEDVDGADCKWRLTQEGQKWTFEPELSERGLKGRLK